MKLLSIVWVLFLMGCVGIPDNVKPVDDFNLERYLGKWYEIARLDHSFERGLTRVTADYSLWGDGGVRVLNRGYSAKENSWKEAEGKAYLWILAREPKIKEDIKNILLVKAAASGFETNKLVFVDHD